MGRHLTLEQDEAFQTATSASMGLIHKARRRPETGDLQDGMLAHYLEQTKLSAANIQAPVELVEEMAAPGES